ncbi:MAG TPA: AI-2E family transporter [Candidatus Solibacter sp.]
MLGLEPKAARYTWTAALVLVALELVYLLRSTLFVFTLALLFAYLLSPLVNLLDRALPNRTRTLALALAYIIFIGIAVLVVTQVGIKVVAQAQALSKKLPDMMAKWEEPSPQAPENLNTVKARVVQTIRTELYKRTSDILNALPGASLKFLEVASDVIYVVIVPVLAFFFLKDGELIRGHMLSVVDAGPLRALVDSLLVDIHLLLAHYMRALVLLSLNTFVFYSVAFTIIGMPFGILLAVMGMCLEFIPMIGPLTAAAAILIVAAVSGAHILTVLIFLVAYRMLQDYFVSPHLMGQGVELHPLLVLFGVFGGAEVAGVAGSFLSVPVLALARILYLRVRRARLGQPSMAPLVLPTR